MKVIKFTAVWGMKETFQTKVSHLPSPESRNFCARRLLWFIICAFKFVSWLYPYLIQFSIFLCTEQHFFKRIKDFFYHRQVTGHKSNNTVLQQSVAEISLPSYQISQATFTIAPLDVRAANHIGLHIILSNTISFRLSTCFHRVEIKIKIDSSNL